MTTTTLKRYLKSITTGRKASRRPVESRQRVTNVAEIRDELRGYKMTTKTRPGPIPAAMDGWITVLTRLDRKLEASRLYVVSFVFLKVHKSRKLLIVPFPLGRLR